MIDIAADVAFTLSPMGRERREDREIAYAEEIVRLRAGIEAYLTGDYPNPRQHRPGNCEHGVPYYEECGACDCAHFMRLLAAEV